MPLYEFYNYRTVADRYVIEAASLDEANDLSEVAHACFDELESECIDGDIHGCSEVKAEDEPKYTSRRDLVEAIAGSGYEDELTHIKA